MLIAGFGWRALFLVNLPLGVLALWLTYRHLPLDRPRTAVGMARLDPVGTMLLAVALLAYTLAMTLGRGQFGVLNVVLLVLAVLAGVLFVYTEARVSTPLVSLRMFRDPGFSAGLAMNVLVATVMMATLVVGPFYLSRTLGLGTAAVGVVMAMGPVIAAFSGVPAGRLVDHRGAGAMRVAGLAGMVLGSAALAVLPVVWGVVGYVVAIAVLTPGYQLFQAANNTAAMRGVRADQRGVVSGLLNLSRNLGLVTGASAMGAVFASAAATSNFTTAQPGAIATGLQVTFGVATVLAGVALVLAARRVR